MNTLAERYRARIEDVNRRGLDALDGLMSLYAEDLVFIDAIQEIRGRAGYREMNERLLRRAKSVRIELHSLLGSDDELMGVGVLTVYAKVGPTIALPGAMHMRTKNGLIVYQRDYLDMGTSIGDAIPVVGPLYRKAMVALFG